MSDKEYEKQKARVNKYREKWFDTLGLGWYEVKLNWSQLEDRENHDTAAKTTWRWQYRSAEITFFLPAFVDLDDDDVESIVVHEFAHILTGPMVQNAPDENTQLMEYGTECVARALIWARLAGENKLNKGRKK